MKKINQIVTVMLVIAMLLLPFSSVMAHGAPKSCGKHTVTWVNGATAIYCEQVEDGATTEFNVAKYGEPKRCGGNFVGWTTNIFCKSVVIPGENPIKKDTVYFAVFEGKDIDWPEIDWTKCDWSKCDWAKYLPKEDFVKCFPLEDILKCFKDYDLTKIFPKYDWSKFEWSKIDWTKFGWGKCDWGKCDWSKIDWSKYDWSKFDWSKCDWSKFDWSKIDWGKCDWSKCDWSKLDWSKIDWSKCTWIKCDWSKFDWKKCDCFKFNWWKCDWPGFEWPDCDWSCKDLYTVSWRNYDGTLLHQDKNQIPAGTRAWYVPAFQGIPTRKAEAGFVYEFVGWSTDPKATEPMALPFNGFAYYSEKITADTTYYAIFKKIAKTIPATENVNITWKNGDQTIYSIAVPKGSLPVYNVLEYGTPKKFAEGKICVFIGWSTDPAATVPSLLAPVQADTTFYAVYSIIDAPNIPGKGDINVTWKNGEQTIYTTTVEKGTVPHYNALLFGFPIKAPVGNTIFTFIGWNTDPAAVEPMEIVAVDADVTYYAIYQSQTVPSIDVPGVYTVTWKNYDGTVLHEDKEQIIYGTKAMYVLGLEGVPTRPEDDQFTYEFLGFAKDPKATEPMGLLYDGIAYYSETVTEDLTYYAIFKAIAKPVEPVAEYTITWVVDGKVTTETYKEGETPVFKGDLTKAEDAEYTYKFTKWTPEIVPVTGNATYTAAFEAVKKGTSPKTGDGAVLPIVLGIVVLSAAAAFVYCKKKVTD